MWFFLQSPSVDHARGLINSGKLREAGQELAGLDQSSPAVAHLTGVVRYKLRQYPLAIESLSRAVKSEPENSAVYRESVRMLGLSHYLSGHYAQAVPWLEKARAGANSSIETLYMLGISYIQRIRPKEARHAFAAMFGMAADSASAHLLTAQMMVRQDLDQLADEELKDAVELDPKLPGVHFLIGELAIYRAQIDRAIEELNKEIVLNPNFGMAYYRLGDAFTRREQWQKAIPELQKSIWLNPTFSGPYILLGKAYLRTGELENAEGMLKRALQIDTQNASAHYLLGQVLMQAGRSDEAKVLLRRSQELRKNIVTPE